LITKRDKGPPEGLFEQRTTAHQPQFLYAFSGRLKDQSRVLPESSSLIVVVGRYAYGPRILITCVGNATTALLSPLYVDVNSTFCALAKEFRSVRERHRESLMFVALTAYSWKNPARSTRSLWTVRKSESAGGSGRERCARKCARIRHREEVAGFNKETSRDEGCSVLGFDDLRQLGLT
jgi:hypothetical protein